MFLPSYAKPENVILKLKDENSIYINNQEFLDGDNLENVKFSMEYMLSLKNSNDKYPIQFLQSANVATMYVNTQTGSMDRIYADKNNKEKASISLYTCEGKLDYAGVRYGDSIKCRGNSTFSKDKKPFLINLDKPQGLLGMGSARKWVLLANAYDITNLRNKLVLDFAKKTSLKWTPDCEYVDLYLNGVYNGLYLLCEKVEVGENRLDIDSNDGFLIMLNPMIGNDNRDMSFETNKKRTIEIIHPKKCSKQTLNRMKNKIDVVEFYIKNKRSDINDFIDLDTWAIRYLIDEIFLNIDGDFKSSYFYCSGLNGKIYAGPIWDYDLCLGNGYNKKTSINTMLRSYKPWYKALYENEVFSNKVKELYHSDYKTLLKGISEHDISMLEHLTYYATKNNNVRWDINRNEYKEQIENIKNFISDRMTFFEEYWSSTEEYCEVVISQSPLNRTFDQNDAAYLTVKSGTIFTPSRDILRVDGDITLVDASTGEEFDFSQPIYEDKVIYAKTGNESDQNEIISNTEELNSAEQMYVKLVKYLELAILGIFLILLAVLAFVSIKNRQRGGAIDDA